MIVAAIIQARCGSSRLPNKVLRRIGPRDEHKQHRPMLLHVIDRARRIPGVNVVMVTTTTAPSDDAVVAVCRGAGVRWTRGQVPLQGHPGKNDVLAGYVLAAVTLDADIVIRLTADCPLFDPAVAGSVLEAFRAHPACRYASNVHPPSWPDGCDVEVTSRVALEWALAVALPGEREHVTAVIYRHAGSSVVNVALPGGEDHSALKLSVDTAEDLARVQRVHAHLSAPDAYGWRETLAAHARAYPPPLEVRARRIFGPSPRTADRRAAYETGARAAALPGGSGASAANPYSTGEVEHVLHTAWLLGWEDVAALGQARLVQTCTGG
mgnify:FL=1